MPPAPQSLTSPERRAIYIWILRGAPPGEGGTGQLRAIEAGHSGTWSDPSLPGHGFSFDVIIGKPSRFFAFWMTFELDGSPWWLVADGEFETGDSSVELTIFRVGPSGFDAAQARPRSEAIGTAELTFSSCDDGWLKYDIQLDLGPNQERRQSTIVLRRLTPSQRCTP